MKKPRLRVSFCVGTKDRWLSHTWGTDHDSKPILSTPLRHLTNPCGNPRDPDMPKACVFILYPFASWCWIFQSCRTSVPLVNLLLSPQLPLRKMPLPWTHVVLAVAIMEAGAWLFAGGFKNPIGLSWFRVAVFSLLPDVVDKGWFHPFRFVRQFLFVRWM